MSTKLQIDELGEVELLTILRKKLSKKIAIMKILLKISNSFRQLYLVIQPIKQ